MASNKPLPIPADLQAIGASMLTSEIAKHYGVSDFTVRKWLAANPEALKGRARNGSEHRIKQMPDDFAETALRIVAKAELQAHYGVCWDVVQRWLRQMPEYDRHRYEALHKAAVRAEAARRAAKGREVAIARAAERRAAMPPKPKPARTGYALARRPGTLRVSAPPVSVASQAADVLKRAGFIPVFDAGRVYGKHLDGIYVVGRMRMPVAEMLELARSRGWDADAWKRVA